MRKHVREGKVEEIRAKPDGWYSYRRVIAQPYQHRRFDGYDLDVAKGMAGV